MTLPPSPTLLEILHVCLQMRPDEIHQWEAFHGELYDPDKAAALYYLKGGPKFVLHGDDGLPYCVGGFESDGAGVMLSWMAGTPEGWVKYWRRITLASNRVMRALLSSPQIHRIHTNCLASRAAAMVWYERGLGLKQEHVIPDFTPDGDGLALFARERR